MYVNLKSTRCHESDYTPLSMKILELQCAYTSGLQEEQWWRLRHVPEVPLPPSSANCLSVFTGGLGRWGGVLEQGGSGVGEGGGGTQAPRKLTR